LLKLHPPHVTDEPIIAQMKKIGIEPGKSFDIGKLDPVIQRALETAPQDGQKLMAWKVPTLARVANGWSMNTDTMGVYGNYYLKRAIVSQLGLGANLPEDAVYPLNLGDESDKPLDGANKYTVTFERGAATMLTKRDLLRSAALAAMTVATTTPVPAIAQAKAEWPDIREAKAIAEEGFIYGLPIVMNYAVMYEYAVDRNSGQFKAPFNQIKNEARVFTYKDTSIVTPNSDTPYSFLWSDLRAEPMVLSVPAADKGRYYAV